MKEGAVPRMLCRMLSPSAPKRHTFSCPSAVTRSRLHEPQKLLVQSKGGDELAELATNSNSNLAISQTGASVGNATQRRANENAQHSSQRRTVPGHAGDEAHAAQVLGRGAVPLGRVAGVVLVVLLRRLLCRLLRCRLAGGLSGDLAGLKVMIRLKR
jgi:hypothetical protein